MANHGDDLHTPKPHTLALDTDVLGHGSVVLDGHDISNIAREVRFRAGGGSGELTEAVITLLPRTTRADLEALVRLEVPIRALREAGMEDEPVDAPYQPSGEEFVRWLRSLDPAGLEARALSRQDLADGPASAVAAVLATLVDMIEETRP